MYTLTVRGEMSEVYRDLYWQMFSHKEATKANLMTFKHLSARFWNSVNSVISRLE